MTKMKWMCAAAWMFLLAFACAARAENVLVEAESFQDRGGWSLDTQFIEIMGSPYLLAHGLGEPVKDATTTVTFPSTGTYRVFVRTKDWVATWKAPGAPGKFQLLVENTPLKETFGTKGAEWAWQSGGSIEIKNKEVKLALHDLTGFDGRCDAIAFTTDPAFSPPNQGEQMAHWRSKTLGLPEKPVDAGNFDVVVIGGGYAGMGSALSAARMGCKVALIQDRGVLGGNGSSEVRVWAMGGIRTGLYPHLGEIIEEFMDHAKASPGTYEEFGDAKKEALVRAEKNISLFLNNHAIGVEKDGKKIKAVTALNTITSALSRFSGSLFVDCTGHATIGALAGAELTIKEEGHMGMSNMWRWTDTPKAVPFPEIDWAVNLDMADFPYPNRGKAEWFWESGFNKHPLHDLEYTRDWNLRAAYGAFNAMKNKGGKEKHENAKLEWIAYIGGTRESRQLIGDVLLTREDIVAKKDFPDGCVPTTWDIDLHYPKEQFMKKVPDDPFISKANFGAGVDRKHGYPVPYRCMYSKNIENLFMAGRCVSVTHEALGTVRVMKTGGMIGEVVGKAASICMKEKCSPREVYEKFLSELKELMSLPGKARRETYTGKIDVPAGGPTPTPSSPSTSNEPKEPKQIDPKLPDGITIDDVDATFTGKWTEGTGLAGFIGSHYLYASPKDNSTAKFQFVVKTAGTYELRLSHQEHENRSEKTPVTITSADGTVKTTVNQRVDPPLNGFVSLGKFRFAAGQPGSLVISGEGANGLIHVDALQILPAQ
jgi:hypothetical protein